MAMPSGAVMAKIKLIVGLGNPDPKYLTTRHNAGFWFVDRVARSFDVDLKIESKFKAATAEVFLSGNKVRLCEPLTYMNNSGFSVAAIANFYKIEAEEILVAYDDLDFDPGTVRLKQGGSAGRHNGIKSIIECLAGQKQFWRCRIGIGHPGDRSKVTGFVLGRPSAVDLDLISGVIDRVLVQLNDVVSGDFQKVMNELHCKE
jgi:peptidyl-tRNA hydrolase, PTH1 family